MTLLDVLGELTSDEDRRAAGACFRSLSCHLAEGNGAPGHRMSFEDDQDVRAYQGQG
jgi:hypothetical protein